MGDGSLYDRFNGNIQTLLADREPFFMQISIADLEVIMSVLLDYYPAHGLPDEAADHIMLIARELSTIIESHHPDVEPYLAMVFGEAALRRADIV